MARIEIYGDEAGDFAPPGVSGRSNYFGVTTVVLQDNRLEYELLDLRRELMSAGVRLPAGFHATSTDWPVRRAVYELIGRHEVRVDTTYVTKSRLREHLRASNLRLWKMVWYSHLRHLVPLVAGPEDDLTVVAASITTAMKRSDVEAALADVVEQVHVGPGQGHLVQASSDLCLQAADFCAWAIQRRLERDTTDSYEMIQHLIQSERLLF